MMTALLHLGVPAPQRTSYLMTTYGRTSGLERTTPVNLVEADGERWLVSPYGNGGWVHNLRANGALRLRRSRAQESLVAEAVGAEHARAVLGGIDPRWVGRVPGRLGPHRWAVLASATRSELAGLVAVAAD